VLGPDDGMPVACALNFDHVALAQRDRIGPVICESQRPGGRRSGRLCSKHVASANR
jgi:hypothetical protein